ncbi:phosphopantothenate--cysteine ligase [Aureococcus anophagefferens]|uniref:Phosphopantothenate--cysteine ligase n=1 Tax=Aureococcus anophagefferens TaxID=44056 RepID=A0ABR1GET6_AURAN
MADAAAAEAFFAAAPASQPDAATVAALEAFARRALRADPGAALAAVAAGDAAYAAGAAALRDGARFAAAPFSSVHAYLGLLRAACAAVAPLGHRAVVVCAAAVSDFHVATPPEHKIQSTGGAGLTLELDAVPKMLGLLKPWGASCVVSFKLETDAALVDAKAAAALEHYGVDGVVANLLDSYATRATVHAPAAFDAPLRLEDARGVDGALADAIVRIHGAAGAPPPPDPLAVRLVDEAAADGGDACLDAKLAAGVAVHHVAAAACGVPSWRKVPGEWGDDYGPVERGGALWFEKAGAPKTRSRILLLHGGVHCYYSAKAYAPLASRLAALTGLPVLAPDYRLAPSCPFPAAVDDCGAALAWLAAHELDGAGAPAPSPADALFLAGDSSGGGLAVAAALANGAAASRAPVAGVVGFSPWLDLTCGGESYETRKFDAATKRGDPVFNSGDAETERDETREVLCRKSTGEMAAAYLAGADPADPRASPAFAPDLSALPPTLFVCGDADVVLDDARDFAAKCDNVDVDVWPRLWHDFVMYTEGCGTGAPLAEADVALRRAARWMRKRAPGVGGPDVFDYAAEDAPAAAPEKPKARRHLHHGGYHWRAWRTWRHRRRGHEDTGEPKGGGATAADY